MPPGRSAAMPSRNGSNALRVGPARLERAGLVHRVVADVDGVPAWIESADVPLRASAEAFGSAFLLPALHHGRTLVFDDPVDALWLANNGRLQEVFRRWWRYEPRVPRTSGGTVTTREAELPAPRSTALFFSGGVDSFYSLLRGDAGPDRLLTVHGLDVAHDDDARMEPLRALTRAVAAERGVTPVIVRTNLRTHPAMAGPSWEKSHGGVMAAVGHALGDSVSEVLISSSITTDRERAWGSHWETDPLHSSPRVRFRQVGMEVRRVEKLRRMAGEPLVQRHLRVCWQKVATLNCNRCSKCLLTRLVLAECGVLERCTTFEGTATLARDVAALDRYRSTSQRALGELAESPRLDPPIRAAVAALLERTRIAQLPWMRARRALRSRVAKWIGARR